MKNSIWIDNGVIPTILHTEENVGQIPGTPVFFADKSEFITVDRSRLVFEFQGSFILGDFPRSNYTFIVRETDEGRLEKQVYKMQPTEIFPPDLTRAAELQLGTFVRTLPPELKRRVSSLEIPSEESVSRGNRHRR